ncbi:hypothetical protein COU17_03370 [Candidatus Kaiserbacteria bacterium CG10_big_fil_rev_8_21_14_0_10_49_17]|uniref:Uncharacterized protein n=1 Tax=Candidatus Kaiserbacteria bacterium CG10_big_fil_rev_8_21_14_0_10_49_17 TaxID=1974609 RepID=A0A2M6WDW5_9BACT|nr:MAG: hypothetical protein COU17_03370 [Candidatus Kaiserbacteria bacterium CG10_big_fil_rev_8_21_14_0_10_49_17]
MKTILFVLPSKMNIRDLVLIPGGVFDMLSKKKDIRLVVVIPRGQYKKFQSELMEREERGEAIFEVVDTTSPKRWYQKAFMFFVKYLVWTDTMQLLAREGVRADVPPAGGRQYLFWVKRLVYQIFGRIPFIKTVVVPRLFLVLFLESPYKNLFEKYHPDLLFISDVKPFWGLYLLAEAKRRGIRSVQMPGNWDHFKYYFPLQSDVLLTNNEPLAEEAYGYENYKRESVSVVGFPRFDFFLRSRETETREAFLKRYGFPENANVILFVSEGPYVLDDGDIVDMLLEKIEDGTFPDNTYILLRPYPPYPGQHGEGEKYGVFEGNPRVAFDTTNSWKAVDNLSNFVSLIAHADVVVETYSTVAIESLVFEKPVVNIGFDGRHTRKKEQSVTRFVHLSHFQHITKTGGVPTVTSEQELIDTVSAYLTDPSHNKEARARARERMCGPLDGASARRLAERIVTEAYAK